MRLCAVGWRWTDRRELVAVDRVVPDVPGSDVAIDLVIGEPLCECGTVVLGDLG